jgi:hypothetical protein
MPTQHEQSAGAYDIRKGAAGYAGIMGSVAGFVVPTVILAFTLPRRQIASHQVDLTLATGLLVVSLLGCLVSAFALAGLAGEKKLTMNLPPYAMYIGVGVVCSATPFSLHAGIRPSIRGASWFAGLALVGTIAVVILGILRTVHPARGPDKGMRQSEVILLQLAMGVFVGLLLVFLPH